MSVLRVITLKEIERVFAILDELNLSREAVVIPLRPAHPGGVRLLPDQRLEIVFDNAATVEENLVAIRAAIEALLAGGSADRVRRADD